MIRQASAEYRVIKITRGWVGVAYTGRGIRALTLPVQGREKALESLRSQISSRLVRGKGYQRLAHDLDRYFQGRAISFNYPLDLTAATPFQRRVWTVLQGIPHGATRTYQEVARAVGMPRAPRAVGQAVGGNPIPLLIPCHRVVGSGGSLGGYAWGLMWKRRLLRVEGIGPRLSA